MGPIPKILSVVLLGGCLVMAVAVAGEPEGEKGTGVLCEGPYKDRVLTAEELATVLRNHQAWLAEVRKEEQRRFHDFGKRELWIIRPPRELWLEAERELLNDTRRANLCRAMLQKANLPSAVLASANLQSATLWGANLQKAALSGVNLQNAFLAEANLQNADLPWANFQNANLAKADLQGAVLASANLQSATLSWADLQGADLRGANLQKAQLVEANLQGADIARADLQGADLRGAKLTRVIYEPTLESLPRIFSLLDSRLEDMVFHTSPAALLTLREAFKKAGMRTQERQLTYAVKHTERLQAWNPSIKQIWRPWDPFMIALQGKDKYLKDTRPWLERLAGKSESLFNYALFELPSGYGLAPGRALWGLLGLIPIFAFPYWIALKRANRRSGIWMIVPADRLAGGRGKEKAALIRPHGAKTWWEHLVAEYRMFRTSLYFSFLSTFHIGWREFNVGSWIAHMQPREYTLRATGWVRMVSGIQSLLSVYLLALWVLTYFGRPFE